MPGNGNSEKKEEKKKKLMFKFDDRTSETFKNLFSGEKKFEKNFTFSSKKKFDFHQRKGKVSMRSSGSSSSNIRISSSDGNSMNAASDNGNLGKGELKFDCDDKSLEIQGKVPAYAEAEVVAVDNNIQCKHSPGQVYVDCQVPCVSHQALPPVVAVTMFPGAGSSPLPEAGVKLKKAYVAKEGDLLVKSTNCAGKKLAVVGDKIVIEHQFKQLQDFAPATQPSSLQFLSQNPQVIVSMSSKGKPIANTVKSVQTPGHNPMPLVPLFAAPAPPNSDAWFGADGVDGDEVTVDNAITDNGSSTTVYCEDKLIALVGNDNICANDSMKKEKCLKIK